MSPDGSAVAVRSAKAGQRDSLAVLDLSNNKVAQVASFTDVDVGNILWVNNQRLVFDTVDKRPDNRDREGGPGLYAVNRDGGKLLQVASRFSRAVTTGGARQKIQPWNTFLLRQPGAQESDSVYVLRPDLGVVGRTARTNLLQLNTLTGDVTTVPRPADAERWLLDQRGEPRLALSRDKDSSKLHYLDPQGGWRQLARFDAQTPAAEHFSPLAFGPDGTLYVLAAAGKDKAAVHTLDLATGKIRPQPMVVTADHDFQGSLVIGKNRLLGTRVLTDAQATIWFDDDMKTVQKQVDERLPGLVNLITLPTRAQTPWLLVESYSDVQPTVFHLYDTQAKTLRAIGHSRPGIRAGMMGRQATVSYKARDNLPIPALLTLPGERNSGAGPMVVLVHESPFARGSAWGWSPASQFLASRGYAVLEPAFRGSTGYGSTHFRSGLKQWGRGMQDDLADGVRWAVEQGIADPKRVCIVGAGYGGYAVLMALARDAELFQCGASLSGITDIDQVFENRGLLDYDLDKRYYKYETTDILGDRIAHAELLKEISPIERAADVRKPLLLAFGGAHERSARATRRFHAAVSKGNPDAELLEFANEQHRLAEPENRIHYWTRVESFLQRHIGQ